MWLLFELLSCTQNTGKTQSTKLIKVKLTHEQALDAESLHVLAFDISVEFQNLCSLGGDLLSWFCTIHDYYFFFMLHLKLKVLIAAAAILLGIPTWISEQSPFSRKRHIVNYITKFQIKYVNGTWAFLKAKCPPK